MTRHPESVRDWTPADQPLCSFFGRASLPCDAPVVVITKRVAPVRAVERDVCEVLCQRHWTARQTGVPVSAQKLAAKNRATARLIAAHRDEFNGYYTEALES